MLIPLKKFPSGSAPEASVPMRLPWMMLELPPWITMPWTPLPEMRFRLQGQTSDEVIVAAEQHAVSGVRQARTAPVTSVPMELPG